MESSDCVLDRIQWMSGGRDTMAKNLKFFLDDSGQVCARGPQTESVLLDFLERDVRDNDHVCHDLLQDILAVQSEAAESREFETEHHVVGISSDSITLATKDSAANASYQTGLKHFREIIEDWEAFILDEA